ncbi:ABC transporter permease [Sporosalibacterium faouarense]|uniref:ABC transporter permease n=1 Tax=Sporosalibacterium faouarense TaxID=516123 RepID=UPI00192CA836|nr:ABC transporter permease [Sporosalibacterium faouarense]
MINKYTWIVLKKELTDIFRDKKTLITSILIPILVFPIMAFVIGMGTDKFIDDSSQDISIAIISEEESKLESFIRDHEGINVVAPDNPEEALSELDIKAIIKIPQGVDQQIENDEMPDIEILYDSTSTNSDSARSRVAGIIGEYSQSIVFNRLEELGIDPQVLNPISVSSTPIANQDEDAGLGIMILSMLLPLMLTVWAAVGGIPAATDLGAGEKERQTLEPLLTTRANRLSLLMGKYFAVVIAAIMGTIAALIGFGIAGKINPNFMGTGSGMPLKSAVAVGILCIGLALVFSALELAISFFARSFKEAQTYLSPLTIVVMLPAYLTMYLDGKEIPEYFFHIPLVNTIAVIKESIVLVFNIQHILIVSGWTILYIALALFLTVKMFNKESVMFRS